MPTNATTNAYNGPALPKMAENIIQFDSAHFRASVRDARREDICEYMDRIYGVGVGSI